jgi:hypothetical protein
MFLEPGIWLKVSISARITKKRVIVDRVDMRTNGRMDHTMKDTSRQNRTPLSGLGREQGQVGYVSEEESRGKVSEGTQENRRTS